jgi:hypothetical protein
MGRLATAVVLAGRGRRAPRARPALEMARRVGDKQALADAVAASYVVGWRPDSLDQRLATARELAHVATEMGDAALEALARNLIVTNLRQRGEIDGAERELAALNRPIGTAPTALAQMGRGRSASQARTPRGTARGLRGARARGTCTWSGRAGRDRDAGIRGTEAVAARRAGPARRTRRCRPRLRRALLPDLRLARALAWVYELDRRRDARRELEGLARDGFADLPRDWRWLGSIASLSEVVDFLDDARRAELLYELLLPFADRCVAVENSFCLARRLKRETEAAASA